MQLTAEQKNAIRNAACQAVKTALEGVDTVTRGNLYNEVMTEAKAGACDALLQKTGGNQAAAAELGGLNRATLRGIVKRSNLI
jgi:DNA-binding protein Fis